MVLVILLLGIKGKLGCIWYSFCIRRLLGKLMLVVLILIIMCLGFVMGFVMFLYCKLLMGLKVLYIIVFIYIL